MQGTTFATVVQEDPNIEPVLYPYTVGRADHICDPAPTNWTVQDRIKYHQVELEALLGGPIPANMRLVMRELGKSLLMAVPCRMTSPP
jgi:hypothetical protein